jgi:hypothetical protein
LLLTGRPVERSITLRRCTTTGHVQRIDYPPPQPPIWHI